MSKRSGVTVKTLQLREAQLSILDMVIPLLWLCDVDCVHSTVLLHNRVWAMPRCKA